MASRYGGISIMSELRTNRIIPRDGLSSGYSGGIIQMKQTVLTSAAYQNIDAGANYDLSTLTCAITPKRSDSKIMIMAMLSLVMERGNAGYLKIKRNGSYISGSRGDSSGSRELVTTGIPTSVNDKVLGNVFVQFLDSPASTSAQTYMFTISHGSNAQRAIYVNKTDNDGNSYQYTRGISTMTLMEISG